MKNILYMQCIYTLVRFHFSSCVVCKLHWKSESNNYSLTVQSKTSFDGSQGLALHAPKSQSTWGPNPISNSHRADCCTFDLILRRCAVEWSMEVCTCSWRLLRKSSKYILKFRWKWSKYIMISVDSLVRAKCTRNKRKMFIKRAKYLRASA